MPKRPVDKSGKKLTRSEAIARAVELAAAYWPLRLIAEDLGVTRATVQRYLADYTAGLPTAGRLTRDRLRLAMLEADNLNDILRIAAMQRHYLEPVAEGADDGPFIMGDISTVEGRKETLFLIGKALGERRITRADVTSYLALVKEACSQDGLADELATIEKIKELVFVSGEYSQRNAV